MKHFFVIFYFLLFSISISTIGLFLFAYTKFKLKTILYYTLFLISMAVFFLSYILSFYIYTNTREGISILSKLIECVNALSAATMTYYLIVFALMAFYFVNMGIPVKIRYLIFSFSLFTFVFFLLNFFRHNVIFTAAIYVILFSTLILCIVILIKAKTVENEPGHMPGRKAFINMCIVFLSISPLDSVFRNMEPFQEYHLPFGFVAFPLLYLGWHILSIYLGVKYYLENSIKDKAVEIELNDTFINNFGITKREKEVVLLLIKGCSYDEIAATLNISITTVKTHVSNIYKKTNNKNKIELLNTIMAFN